MLPTAFVSLYHSFQSQHKDTTVVHPAPNQQLRFISMAKVL